MKKYSNNNNNNNNKVFGKSKPKLHIAYYSAADILLKLNEKSSSLNNLMNDYAGLKYMKMIYALAVKVLKNIDIIEQIKNELPDYDRTHFNSYIIEILIGELLFGEKDCLKYRKKNEVKFIADNKQLIMDIYQKLKNETKSEMNEKISIRYIRINQLKITKLKLIEKLKQLQLKEKFFPRNDNSFEQFKMLAMKLNSDEFMFDFHFNDVILFNDQSSKLLTDSELYRNGFISMQDKSSILAIEAMNLKEDMIIMDAFAAPGMKTAAIASRLNNNCILYANDVDKKRFNIMKDLLSLTGTKFKSLTQDFTQMDPSNYPDLDILLLDPSCSGSGINRRLEYNNNEINPERIEKLAKFQLSVLQHALTFNAKKIIYCTCSKIQIENEDVIKNLLDLNPDINYSVIDPLPEWPCRGMGNYPFSSYCLRANLESTLTNGFFCCVLQRNDLMEKKIETTNLESSTEEVIQPKKIGSKRTKTLNNLIKTRKRLKANSFKIQKLN